LAAETAASGKADDTGSEFGDDVESDLGSRGGTPPLAPPTRGGGFFVAISDSCRVIGFGLFSARGSIPRVEPAFSKMRGLRPTPTLAYIVLIS
jgi:hypothetical protein